MSTATNDHEEQAETSKHQVKKWNHKRQMLADILQEYKIRHRTENVIRRRHPRTR